MIQTDLKAAGIAYRDSSDRVADFHSLRHSFITALAMSQAPVKVIQSLARHSTPTLTLGVYAHVGLFDQTLALDALPGVSPTEAAKAATGTDGKHTSKPPCLLPAYGGDGTRRKLSVTGDDEPTSEDVKIGRHESDSVAPEVDGLQEVDAMGRDLSEPDGRKKRWRECMGIRVVKNALFASHYFAETCDALCPIGTNIIRVKSDTISDISSTSFRSFVCPLVPMA